MKIENSLENQIGLGKRVGITGSKPDIFSRPWAEPFCLEERLAKRGGILIFGERNGSAQHAPAEVSDRFSPSGGRADRA